MSSPVSHAYRPGFFGPGDGLFHRCLAAATVAGAVFVAVVMLVPIEKRVLDAVQDSGPRLAHIEFDKTPLLAPPPMAVLPPRGAAGDDVSKGAPGPLGDGSGGVAKPKPRAATGILGPGGGTGSAPGLGNGHGESGRARAEALLAASLGGGGRSAGALDNSLRGLNSALQSASNVAASAGAGIVVSRPSASLSGGRADAQVAGGASYGAGAGTGSADLGGSGVRGSGVSVGALRGPGGQGVGAYGDGPGGGGPGGGGGIGGGRGGGVGTGVGPGGGWGGDGAGADGGGGSGIGGGGGGGRGVGAAPGIYRSNASLMAVIQKYQAGIQFCYGNELKRHDGLRGKLVVSLTVSASGDVTNAVVVQNTLGVPALESCALSQIRDWKFARIAEGVTTFQVPFVFTPPQ